MMWQRIVQDINEFLTDDEIAKAGLEADPKAVERAVESSMGLNKSLIDIADDYLGYDDRDVEQSSIIASFIVEACGLTINPSKTAWCAAYINAVVGSAGLEGTGKLNARSFLDWGRDVSIPNPGDVVVLWRESPESWKGHVGLFVKIETIGGKKYVSILGGNQGHSAKVSINRYPVDRVLGYRRPVGI